MGDYRPKIEQRVLSQVVQCLLLLGVALVQLALAPTFWRFRIDWVLVCVVTWTLLRGLYPGVRWAIYGGLSLDLLTPQLVGSHLFALLACAIGIATLTESLDRDQLLLIIASTLGASLVYGLVLALVQRFGQGPIPLPAYLMIVIVPTALINTIAAIPTSALLRRFVRRGRPVVSEF